MISTILPRALALAILVAPSAAQAQANVSFPDRVCSVVDHGAEGSLIWSQLARYDTAAFQAAIDACAAAGGGTVDVPRGEWMIGPIYLKSGVRLRLAKGAELLGGTDPALFGGDAAASERIGLINIANARNVAITGEGTIDGQGAVWWERMRAIWRSDSRFASDGQARQQYRDPRPRLILVTNSSHVAIEGVRIVNSPSYHVVLSDSEWLTVRGTEIRSPAHGPNTDAIDPVRSRHVLIAENLISVGDDAVAIKGGRPDPGRDAVSADILITGNRILAGRGICIGSETSGGVRRIRVENNRFEGSMYGFRIKTARGRGGEVADVVFRDDRMTDVEVPLVFTAYYAYRPMDLREAEKQLEPGGFVLGNQIWPGEADPVRPVVADETPHFSGIVVDGLTATGADRIGVATGLPEAPILGLSFRNVRVEARTGFLVRHAIVTAKGVKFGVTEGPALIRQAGGAMPGI